jgi:ClpP class serine protease
VSIYFYINENSITSMSLLNSILRDAWMIEQNSVDPLSALAQRVLDSNANQLDVALASVSSGLFSEIPLPSVPNSVAMVPIVGVMTKANNCGAMGTRATAQLIEAAAADSGKSAIIVYFDGVPGGQVDGTQELANVIARAKQSKPVVAAISGMACSAGIWAASQASEIYTLSGTDQVGCIGVMARLRKKDGAEANAYEVVISDESPLKNAEFADTSLLKSQYLNPVARLFKADVKSGRGDRLKDDSVLDGLTYVAADAKKAGLIDGTMPFAKVVARAQYLSKNYRKDMTGKATAQGDENPTLAFQHVLRAANAEAATPVEEGFALTEEQMNTADAHIASLEAQLATERERANTSETQFAEISAQLSDATANLDAANARIAALEQEAARVDADPVEGADPAGSGANKFMTKWDLEKQAQNQLLAK